MPTISFTVDGPAGKGGTARFEPRAMFEADGKLVTSWASPRLVKYTNNTAVSVVLPEGPWKVGGLSGGQPLPIDVGSVNADLKDLIVFNLPPSAPATTLSQAVAAWMDSNVNTEVTEPLVEGILANPASGARAVLDETYAPQSLVSTVAAKYTKPATGVPKTDLAPAVQTSLGKADSALQNGASSVSLGFNTTNTPRVPFKSSYVLGPDDNATTTDHIGHLMQNVVQGDWTNDTGVDPKYAWGCNIFTATGVNAGDAQGVVALYGGLIEADVRSPAGVTLGKVIGLQAEASFAHAASGATVENIISLQIENPRRKDGATGGVATNAYGIYVKKVNAADVGATTAYSLFVAGGNTKFQGPTVIDLALADAGDTPLKVVMPPSPTAHAFVLTDVFGNTKARISNAGAYAAAGHMVAWEGQTQQTRIGSAQAGSYPAITFGTASDAEIYRQSTGVLKTAGKSFGVPATTTANRANAVNAGAAGMCVDTTLGQLLISDGTNWKVIATLSSLTNAA